MQYLKYLNNVGDHNSMSKKPEDKDLQIVCEIKSLPISLQQSSTASSSSNSNSNKPNQAQQNNTEVKQRSTSKGKCCFGSTVYTPWH